MAHSWLQGLLSHSFTSASKNKHTELVTVLQNSVFHPFLPLYLPVTVTKEGLICLYFFFSLGRMPRSWSLSVAPEFHFSICQWKHTHMQTFVSDFTGFSSLKYVTVALKKSWRTQKFSIQFKVVICKFCHYQVSSLSKMEWLPVLTLFYSPII